MGHIHVTHWLYKSDIKIKTEGAQLHLTMHIQFSDLSARS